MTGENFEPYWQTIANCIESCTNNEQLACCYDIIERFKEVFKPSINPILLHEKAGRLYAKYHTRQAQIGIM